MKLHTPGPWRLEGEWVYGWEDGQEVAVAGPLGDTSDRAVANGELIAAAPTLLELLQRFVNHFPGDDGLDEACKCGGLDALLVEARVVVAEAIQPSQL